MPELPEVEVICRFLRNTVKNKRISSVIVNYWGLRKSVTQDIDNILKNKIISNIGRRGKYIILHTNSRPSMQPYFISTGKLSTPKQWLCNKNIVIHLGMSGKLIYKEHSNYVQNGHDHVIFLFSDNTSIIFNDPRRFGLVVALTKEQLINFFNNLGIEPLTDEFNGDYLQKLLKNKKANIKSVLMNNRLVVGIGNIYASESLFRARISPLRLAKDLNYIECEKLTDQIKNTLNDAITAGGTTLKDYAQPSGAIGCFQNSFYVYGKIQKPCKICNSIIKLIRQNGRSTYFCNVCQK